MKKHYLSLFLAIACLAGKATAQQHCYTDEVHTQLVQLHPELAKARDDYEKQIQDALKKIDLTKAAKTTFTDQSGNDSFWYDIPIVVHLVHDYGNENLSDDAIFNDLVQWNIVYAKQNADTSEIVPPFRIWLGNPHIRLHLATKDPNGNPTKGITRHRSYLTYAGGEQSKLDDWQPTSYVNIWFINQMSGANTGAAAYAHFPSDANSQPYYDGIIALYDYANTDKTINHEMGHCFSLFHPWGGTNSPGVACGDDAVDDTPPTKGHVEPGCQYSLPSSNPNSTYDSACASNYYKLYTNAAGGDSLVNYPDTTNAQNIMDYTYCSRMFTKGQVYRMHLALNNSTGGRNNLWDAANLVATGAMENRPDLKPIPDFYITKGGASASTYMDKVNYFTFPGVNVNFYNSTWNDTVTNLTWTFSNGATTPTSTSKTLVSNSFTTPGWVSVSMTATGNNTGDSSKTWDNALFVANTTGTPAGSVNQEFNPSGDVASWPMFNYYNNSFKWRIANVGVYDNYSLEYVGYDNSYDPTTFTFPATGMPKGDFDDFFCVPVDLTSYSAGHCSINFDISGASRSSNSLDITDTLAIDYTINKGTTWSHLTILSKGSLDNRGAVTTPYQPQNISDWSHTSIDIPAGAISNYTTFRFRYKPGVGQTSPFTGQQYSSGNNFYMDNITFKPWPAAVGNVVLNNTNMAVVPNPTSGDAYIVMKDADNTVANIVVTDITGKVVYTTSQQITGNATEILIPHASISVKGMYIVQATTGAKTYTQKLVVY